MNSIKQAVKTTSVHAWWRRFRDQQSYGKWLQSDKKSAPPHKVKELAVAEFGQKYHLTTLVETGTYLGDMIFAEKNNFSKIYSIEIDKTLCENARNRFKNFKNVEILLGDSGVVLIDLVPKLNDGVVFWLDGHYSGGVTGRGSLDSPIVQELSTIFNSSLRRLAILIDDARLFVGTDGYPTMQELRQFVEAKKPGWTCELIYDIIRIYPLL